jgi:SAM-dependent methyltransferase
VSAARADGGLAPAYGFLGDVHRAGDGVHLTGWMLLPDGPFDALQVETDDGGGARVARLVQAGLQAALPRVPRADEGGFVVTLPRPRDDARETRIRLVGLRDGVPAAEMHFGWHEPGGVDNVPAPALMKRVCNSDQVGYFLASGLKSYYEVRRILDPHADYRHVRRLLDWGCGCGRLTRHLLERAPAIEIHGCDIDVEAIDWAHAHLAGGDFRPCGLGPPLPYPSARFDLVVSLSVFTHLTREYQERWLQELKRVLKPGGWLLASVHGEHAGRWVLPEPEFGARFASGFDDSLHDDMLGTVASGDYYRSTFQARAWTLREWSRHLRVIDYVPGSMQNLQDFVLLRNAT